jgi:excisionase family DNA binding protein
MYNIKRKEILRMKIKEMLTVKEAAELCGVSRTTIYNWINNGILGYIQKGYFKLLDKEAVIKASEIADSRKRGGKTRRGEKKYEKKQNDT